MVKRKRKKWILVRDRTLFLLKYKKNWRLSLYALGITLIGLIVRSLAFRVWDVWTSVGLSVVGAGLVVTAFAIKNEYRTIRRQASKVIPYPLKKGLTPPSGSESYVSGRGKQWIVYPELNRLVRKTQCRVPFRLGPYAELPDEGQAAISGTLFCNRPLAFNEPKVKLCSDLTQNIVRAEAVQLRRTDYFSYLCYSVEGGDFQVGGAHYPSPVVDGDRIRHYYNAGSTHHIGVNCWLLSSDGHLILQRQTTAVEEGKGDVVPSGSGSLDVTDLDDVDTFGDAIVFGGMREAGEELGVKRLKAGLGVYEWPAVRCLLFGMAADASRGLVTDFHFLAQVDEPFSQVRIRFDENRADEGQIILKDENEIDLSSAEAAKASVGRIRTRYEHECSVLDVGLLLLEQAFSDSEFWDENFKSRSNNPEMRR